MRWLRRLVGRPKLRRLLDRLAAELRANEHEAAERTAEEACALAEPMGGADLIGPLHALASARLALGKLGAAREASVRAIAVAKEVGAPLRPSMAELTEQQALVEIAEVMQSDVEERAGEAHARALSIVARHPGQRGLEARIAHNYAVLCERLGDAEQATGLYRRALLLAEAEHGREHPALRPTLVRLARLLHAAGDFDGAAALYERALAIAEAEAAGDEVLRAIRVWLGDARTRTVR